MHEHEIRHSPRFAGALLGACIAVAAIVMALPAGGQGGVLPGTLDLSVRTDSTLAATPAAPNLLLHAGNLRAAGPVAAASFELANQAGRELTVGLRAEPSSAELDEMVRVEVEANGITLADSTLAALREGSTGALVLGPGERRRLHVAVSIPSQTAGGYEGRRVAVTIVPVVRGRGAG
jgi:hypothetical protein